MEVALDTINKGSLWARNDKVDVVLLRQSHEAWVVVDLDAGIYDLGGGSQTGTAIARSDVDDVNQRRLAQLPGEGVLAAAVADDEDAQPFLEHLRRGVLDSDLELSAVWPTLYSNSA